MTTLTPSRDIPRLEVYPWALAGALTLLWPLLWFTLWAALRGTLASLAVSFASLRDLRYLPWVVPGQLLLWSGSLAWIAHRLRHDRNPPLPALALVILLMTTFAPSAFYMLRLAGELSPYELNHSPVAVFVLTLLHGSALNPTVLLLTLALGGFTNRKILQKKYAGIQPSWKSGVAAVWVLALAGGIALGLWAGTIFGLLFTAGLGNSCTVYAYRQTIKNRLAAEKTADASGA